MNPSQQRFQRASMASAHPHYHIFDTWPSITTNDLTTFGYALNCSAGDILALAMTLDESRNLSARHTYGTIAVWYGAAGTLAVLVFAVISGTPRIPILPVVFFVWGCVRLGRCNRHDARMLLPKRFTPMEVTMFASMALTAIGLIMALT